MFNCEYGCLYVLMYFLKCAWLIKINKWQPHFVSVYIQAVAECQVACVLGDNFSQLSLNSRAVT